MAKGRSFAAKLAHEISTEGKVMCPNCNTEVKKIKLGKRVGIIRNKIKGYIIKLDQQDKNTIRNISNA